MVSAQQPNTSLDAFIQGLNEVQRQAVTHTGNPLLILAGAGSGKTRVITGKIAYLIEYMGVDPRSILAVTFTNKAAQEMQLRAATLTPQAGQVLIKTFHSFGSWLLRRNAALLSMASQFTIYDDDDQLTLLHSLYPETNRSQLRGLSNQISRAKDFGLGPDDPLEQISHDPEFPLAYQAYEKRLREIGNADFGDLILRTTELLTQHPEVQERMHHRFRVILVDEYQDSNIAQFKLLSALAGPEAYICVVGDDDQSIYRFRGAEVRNILEFSQQFPGTDVIRLEQNYRSTGHILELAGAVVANNQGRLGKVLWTAKGKGELPRIFLLDDAESEAQLATKLLQTEIETGNPLSDTAILYRTNAQSRLFETAFLQAGIPYRIVGTLRFYEREEIKDSIAFLKFLANPKDEVAFRRIINKPARGVGASSLAKILERLGPARGNLLLATEYTVPEVSPRSKKSIASFLAMVTTLSQPPEKGETLAAWVETVIRESGLAEYHAQQDTVAGTQKVQNLEELVNAASLYTNTPEGLTEFLEAVELDAARSRDTESENGVTLITMHNTKGLEFPKVIITGMEEGLFPRSDEDEQEIEEERRLFYVAVTRAQEQVLFTSCRSRRIHGRIVDTMPSRFLSEIPEHLREIDDQTRFAVPRGYPAAHPTVRRGPSSPQTQNSFTFPKGTRVYHDDYGSGEVIKAWENGDNEVVIVQFETGRSGQFIPKYSGLEKIQ